MGHFYFLLGLWVFVLIAFLVSLWRTLKRRLTLPYRADKTLLGANQRSFKYVLERAIGQDYHIHAKVHAIDVIGLRPKVSRRERDLALRRLSDRRFDFLICDKETSAILCAVNLAPRSRLRMSPPRDVLDRICAAAQLPLVRFRERDAYSVVEVEERIFAAMRAPVGRAKIESPSMDEDSPGRQAREPSVLDEHPGELRSRKSSANAGRSEPPVVLRRTSTAKQRPEQPSLVKRRDPTLRAREHHVDDDEPSFEIGDALDDDRPVRSRGR